METKINIIDPSSSEFNRGSFCYCPYLCYNGLAERYNVNLIESFQPEDLDNIPDAHVHIVCLWSYPQIECSLMLAQMLPFMYGKDNVYFVGYHPLIQHLGLRHIEEWLGLDPLTDEGFLKLAMVTYPKNYHKFKRLLLSDCDMHLRSLQKEDKVYPLFTSYGCPNNCGFCPSTKNCGRQRTELPLKAVYSMLDTCIAQGIKYIHLTDEDFFFDIDRAYCIFNHIKGKDMHLIALSSAKAATNYIEKYGTKSLKDAGLEVMEIGFESGDSDVSRQMGVGKSLSDCEKLANFQDAFPFRIFWLILTFFPGETIKSLNETGKFLRMYGFEPEEVMGRLRTNGTKGGLGQFFQPYHGTSIYNTLYRKGEFLTERPIRLIPSYVPNSFLDSPILFFFEKHMASALPYLKLYNVSLPKKPIELGLKIRDYTDGKSMFEKIQIVTAFAILARMNVIE